MRDAAPGVLFHHVGIQTRDLDNALAWYTDFLGAEVVWQLTTFSDLTVRRLPGITRLAEIRAGELRLHLFERGTNATPAPQTSQFQHLCLSVGGVDELKAYRARWQTVQETGKYTFAIEDPPTEIVDDDDGVHSFYALDTDGLELEFTYVPTA